MPSRHARGTDEMEESGEDLLEASLSSSRTSSGGDIDSDSSQVARVKKNKTKRARKRSSSRRGRTHRGKRRKTKSRRRTSRRRSQSDSSASSDDETSTSAAVVADEGANEGHDGCDIAARNDLVHVPAMDVKALDDWDMLDSYLKLYSRRTYQVCDELQKLCHSRSL
ncbi:hypothetical protein PHYPSEUDO_000212 [Phytophthora pseudosyringae]|uniref:Uncharacterized protein n=1 Tax=Phytophthora pseudosyringae TaxID=221518 RepID=A0A8T1WJG0_9STRA|nr:hypothetical protein PHYPSEUDO_000212 [Phytophthora pseudosyringae]